MAVVLFLPLSGAFHAQSGIAQGEGDRHTEGAQTHEGVLPEKIAKLFHPPRQRDRGDQIVCHTIGMAHGPGKFRICQDYS